MTNPLNSLPGLTELQSLSASNALWQYMQAQSSENVQEMAQAASPEVLEIVGHNIRSLLGTLPSDRFDVQVMTNRESMARLLTGAMLGGYYLRTMEQRLQLERAVSGDIPQTDAPKS
jgi:hypothetical protein